MATIRAAAQSVLDEARDGIAWIAVWKKGRSWEAECFWPDDIDSHDIPTFDQEDVESLRKIATIDSSAILVNSYVHNLGSTEDMTRDSLAKFIRWQYEGGFQLLSEYFPK